MLTPISVEEIWIWSLISASSVLVVVIGFSSELPDLLFLAGGFVFVLFLCFCMDGLEGEGVKDLSSRRDKEGAFWLKKKLALLQKANLISLSLSVCWGVSNISPQVLRYSLFHKKGWVCSLLCWGFRVWSKPRIACDFSSAGCKNAISGSARVFMYGSLLGLSLCWMQEFCFWVC